VGKFDTPYVVANVCEAVPETMSLPRKFVLPNTKKTPMYVSMCVQYMYVYRKIFWSPSVQ
jgi:hypothetical protein